MCSHSCDSVIIVMNNYFISRLLSWKICWLCSFQIFQLVFAISCGYLKSDNSALLIVWVSGEEVVGAKIIVGRMSFQILCTYGHWKKKGGQCFPLTVWSIARTCPLTTNFFFWDSDWWEICLVITTRGTIPLYLVYM
jgi:hypothetical protein